MQRVIPWMCVFYLVGIVVYYSIGTNHFISRQFTEYYDRNRTWEGVIVTNPDNGLEQTKIVVRPVGFTEYIAVTLPTGTLVRYGDFVSFTGKIQRPESFTTETGRIFNYPAYLAVKNIYATITIFDIAVKHHDQGNVLFAGLYSIRNFVVVKIVELFPQDEAGLLAGIVIGEQSLLPKNIHEQFQTAGLTHIIVLSGYNITLVATAIMGTFAFIGCGYRSRRIGALVVIPPFVIMTGLNASSVRAGCMTVIMLCLQITTRVQKPWRIMLITLSGMVLVNPVALIYDPSLHLSFLAFAGLMYAVPVTKYWFDKLPELFGLRDIFAETLGVQLFVVPYLVYKTGTISVLILISNILTVPVVPFIMMGGVGVLSLDIGADGITGPFVWLVTQLLGYVIACARIIANNQWATITTPEIGLTTMIGIYGLFTYVIYMVHRKIE